MIQDNLSDFAAVSSTSSTVATLVSSVEDTSGIVGVGGGGGATGVLPVPMAPGDVYYFSANSCVMCVQQGGVRTKVGSIMVNVGLTICYHIAGISHVEIRVKP